MARSTIPRRTLLSTMATTGAGAPSGRATRGVPWQLTTEAMARSRLGTPKSTRSALRCHDSRSLVPMLLPQGTGRTDLPPTTRTPPDTPLDTPPEAEEPTIVVTIRAA